MDTIRAAGLAACALGISFYSDAHAATETDGGLLYKRRTTSEQQTVGQAVLADRRGASDLHDNCHPGGRYLVYCKFCRRGDGRSPTAMKSQARPAFRPLMARSTWR